VQLDAQLLGTPQKRIGEAAASPLFYSAAPTAMPWEPSKARRHIADHCEEPLFIMIDWRRRAAPPDGRLSATSLTFARD